MLMNKHMQYSFFDNFKKKVSEKKKKPTSYRLLIHLKEKRIYLTIYNMWKLVFTYIMWLPHANVILLVINLRVTPRDTTNYIYD